jgi:hypothetical protein
MVLVTNFGASPFFSLFLVFTISLIWFGGVSAYPTVIPNFFFITQQVHVYLQKN